MTGTMVAEIEWPAGWFGVERWQLVELVRVLQHERTGQRMYIAGGVLTDGTNLIGLTWTDGRGRQFVARCGPATGWAVEERIALGAPKYVRRTWRLVVEAMVHGKKAAEAELGGMPS